MSDSREFADWYKKLADTLAVSKHYNLPVYFLLAGYPEKFNALVIHEESFGSIFYTDYIDRLDDDEVGNFFKDTFKQSGIDVCDDALDIMAKFSSGLPLMMQFIGDSVFWACKTDKVVKDDAINGVINAAYEIASKQINPALSQIRSENYENILQFLADNHMQTFKRSEIRNGMKISEGVLSKFLSRMVELGILESVGLKNSGQYEFSNMLYYTYFLIKSFERQHSD